MTEYIRDTYHKEDLPLETVDYAYVDGLNTYMQTAYNCHNNGAVNLLCCLKNFLLYAVRNEWIEKNPFRYYKMKIDKTNVKADGTGLHGCRPPAAGTLHDGRGGTAVDP
ncbi:phage integrase SAM-like domain-containing protein [Alistipes sp.]|uniref:phage integrase SAM-like domain-containing protein n=1 Tax=Alistipes sp. TaxID=1872444 RepID=UPI0031FDFDEE